MNNDTRTDSHTARDPISGLRFVELSHRWGHGTPTLPGYQDAVIYRAVNHAAHGVMSHRIKSTMHSGTHLNAPIHLVPGASGVGSVPLDRLFGRGVVVPVPKSRWELISAKDLEKTDIEIDSGDIVILNTGWHQRYADSQEYFGESPGLSAEAAQWLVNREVKLVGVDTPQVDHPLATSLGRHRNGPRMRRLVERYETETGRCASDAFPDWNPAHRLLLENGIPTIENVGGDVEAMNTAGHCTFHALPWRWLNGDACVIRLMAILDPTGAYRLEPGT